MQKPTDILNELVNELKKAAHTAGTREAEFTKERNIQGEKFNSGQKEAYKKAVDRLESVIRHINTLENKDVLMAQITEIDECLEPLDQDYELPEGAEFMIRHVKLLFTGLQAILKDAM